MTYPLKRKIRDRSNSLAI